mmetsp:Transcript_6549/g.14376  ORF Transcript_6549/g.14376 Transcript_6549/m.14376 type:complete len:223 (-) Transcript_6549:3094-3762(-)
MLESVVELLGTRRPDLLKGGGSFPRLSLGLSKLLFALLDTLVAGIKLIGGTKIGRHALNLSSKLCDLIFEILAELLLVTITEALLELTVELVKVDLTGIPPILEDLGVVTLREVSRQVGILRKGLAETGIAACTGATTSSLLHFFVFVILVVITFVTTPTPLAPRSSSGVILIFFAFVLVLVSRANNGQINLIDPCLLEGLMQLSTKTFEGALFAIDGLGNS